MDSRTRQVLEVDAVLELIAGRASSSLGREWVLALEPSDDAREIERRTAPLRDMIHLLSGNSPIPLGGLFDAREYFEHARIEGSLIEEEHWPRIAVILDVFHRLLRYREEVRVKHTHLAKLLDALETHDDLAEVLRRTFDKNGRIRDDASPELLSARRALNGAEARLLRTVNRIASDLHTRGLLQDNFSTIRNGRHVVPVRTNMRGRLTGIMHGSSATGETVYMEPAEVVEASNEVEALKEQERVALHRILLDLTALLRPWAPQGLANLETAAHLDGMNALSRVAVDSGWSLPHVQANAPVKLFNAHHPLLQLRSPHTSVPITMLLDRGDRCVVLSGPNAGGKTTAMKTLGLTAVLAQCGAPVPAFPDSTLPVLANVLADIGDEQSLSEGISTFSGHMRRIRHVWEQSGPRSLVLLDELGTGTDPQEGGALALALLEGFANRAALIVTTSHLNPVKQWADETPGVRNASFALDPATRSPTFRLRLDLPGASEALEIAEKEGLPIRVLQRARDLVGERHLQMGELLRRIEERERKLGVALKEAEARAQSLSEQEAVVRARADRLRDERREQKLASIAEKDRAIAELKERLETLIAELPSEEELKRRKEALARAREILLRDRSLSEAERARLMSEDESPATTLLPGKRVFHRRLRQWGEIVRVDSDGKRAKISMGRLEIVALVEDVLDQDPRDKADAEEEAREIAEATASGRKARPKKSRRLRNALRNAEEFSLPETRPAVTFSGSRVTSRPSAATSMTLDLHGFRVEEALAELDKYLDRSLLSSYPYVKINHGTGTGRLYKAVHEYLRTHPAVRKYRFANPDEGGGGVTVVEL